MSEGGPCSGCAALSGRISQLESVISGAISTIRALEAEMYGTTSAVQGVDRSIQILQAEVLASLLSVAGALNVIDQSVNQVDADVQRVSSSIAHSEIVAAVSEAGGQMNRIGTAQADLAEHFEKSLARIAHAQRKWDRLDAELIEAYERDIRRLGQEIFDIWDRDFRQPVRGRLTVQARKHLETAARAMEQIRAARHDALDGRLEAIFERLLDFVERRRRFEQELARYITPTPDCQEADLAVEAMLVQSAGAPVRVVVGEQLETKANGDTLRYDFTETSYFQDLRRTLGEGVSSGAVQVQWRALAPAEIDALAAEFRAMAADGLMDAADADWFAAYVAANPPEVAASADLVSPLPTAA